MLEVKNVEVSNLSRSIIAISNSYTVGEINTAGLVSEDDVKVANKLGTDMHPHQSHDGFLKGITVCFDIKYPLYWTPEFQRYHFTDIIMSQSTMHSLGKFFSSELDPFNEYVTDEVKSLCRKYYSEYQSIKNVNTEHFTPEAKELHKVSLYKSFMKLRSNLPSGFEMWETVITNYLQLKTIWVQRHSHPLKEDWGAFCKMIEELPKFKELTRIGGIDG